MVLIMSSGNEELMTSFLEDAKVQYGEDDRRG